jgi:hypothetical protein
VDVFYGAIALTVLGGSIVLAVWVNLPGVKKAERARRAALSPAERRAEDDDLRDLQEEW